MRRKSFGEHAAPVADHQRRLRLDSQKPEAIHDVLDHVETQFAAAWESEFDTEVYQYALERVRSQVASDTWGAFESVWMESRKPRDVARELNRPVDWVYKAKYSVVCRLRDQVQYLTAELPRLSAE